MAKRKTHTEPLQKGSGKKMKNNSLDNEKILQKQKKITGVPKENEEKKIFHEVKLTMYSISRSWL